MNQLISLIVTLWDLEEEFSFSHIWKQTALSDIWVVCRSKNCLRTTNKIPFISLKTAKEKNPSRSKRLAISNRASSNQCFITRWILPFSFLALLYPIQLEGFSSAGEDGVLCNSWLLASRLHHWFHSRFYMYSRLVDRLQCFFSVGSCSDLFRPPIRGGFG